MDSCRKCVRHLLVALGFVSTFEEHFFCIGLCIGDFGLLLRELIFRAGLRVGGLDFYFLVPLAL